MDLNTRLLKIVSGRVLVEVMVLKVQTFNVT
jgi:hypothetical protein